MNEHDSYLWDFCVCNCLAPGLKRAVTVNYMERAARSVAKPLQSEKKTDFFIIKMERGKIEFERKKRKPSQEQRSHLGNFVQKRRITVLLFGQPLANSKIYLEKLPRGIRFSRDIEKQRKQIRSELKIVLLNVYLSSFYFVSVCSYRLISLFLHDFYVAFCCNRKFV